MILNGALFFEATHWRLTGAPSPSRCFFTMRHVAMVKQLPLLSEDCAACGFRNCQGLRLRKIAVFVASKLHLSKNTSRVMLQTREHNGIIYLNVNPGLMNPNGCLFGG